MNNVCIITARGGSNRIPRKNIKNFLGKPIIAYSIETALKSKLFNEVIVSTDDEEIAEIAKIYGATVPFYRSTENSDDFSGTAEVIIEVINELKNLGKNYVNVCCVYPTAPFITIDSLQKGYKLLVERNYDSVFPVCAFSFPIQRSLQMDSNGKVEMMWPENLMKRSQDLLATFHDAGQFYWVNSESILLSRKMYTDNSGAIELSELEVQDIDNQLDWDLAEIKYKLIKEIN